MFTNHIFGGFRFRYMQADHITHIQQLRQMAHLSGITERQFVFDIVKIDIHTDGFRQDPQLCPDMAVTDNPQLFTARLVAAFCLFIPDTAMRFGIRLRNTAQQQ